MISFDYLYQHLLRRILTQGAYQEVRGEETKYLLNQSIEIDLSREAFPACTLRNVYPTTALQELHWLINGKGDISKLKSPTMRRVWGAYADDQGLVHNSYYHYFRQHNGVDQLIQIVKRLNKNPHRRDLIVTMYDPALSGQPPCQSCLQFHSNGKKLNLTVTARSSDVVFGLVSDIQVFAGLLILISKLTEQQPGILYFFMGNAHYYTKHTQLVRSLIHIENYFSGINLKLEPLANSLMFDFEVSKYRYSDFDMSDNKVLLGDLDFYN